MKREALYHADTNELEELPQMEKPKKPRRLNYDLAGALYSACLIKYEADLAGYNGHLASLRRLPCSPQPGFKDGEKYVEGKDYEVKEDYQCSRHTYLLPDEGCDGQTTAIPLAPVKSEDDLYIEMVVYVEHELNRRTKLKDIIYGLQKHFIITKR